MDTNFLNRKARHLLKFITYEEVYKTLGDSILIPEIEKQEIDRIIQSPKDELELNFAEKYLDLLVTFSNKCRSIKNSTTYKVFESDGYEYIDFGSQLVIDAFNEIIKNYNECGSTQFMNFTNNIEGLVSDAALMVRGEGKQKFNKTCCDVNLLYSIYFNELIHKLTSEKFVISKEHNNNVYTTNDINLASITLGWLIRRLFYYGVDINKNDNEITEEVLKDACLYAEQFKEYINTLAFYTRKK